MMREGRTSDFETLCCSYGMGIGPPSWAIVAGRLRLSGFLGDTIILDQGTYVRCRVLGGVFTPSRELLDILGQV